MEEQLKTPLSEKPKVTLEDFARKMAELDREIKYLINKAKTFRPKPKEEAIKINETVIKTGDYFGYFLHELVTLPSDH